MDCLPLLASLERRTAQLILPDGGTGIRYELTSGGSRLPDRLPLNGKPRASAFDDVDGEPAHGGFLRRRPARLARYARFQEELQADQDAADVSIRADARGGQ